LEKSKAVELIALYFNTFPGIKNFIESAHKMAQFNKYVITPLGQRKRELGAHDCFKSTASYNASLRNGQNVLIQSTTSSVGLVTFAELNNRLKHLGTLGTCTVYDSLEAAVPIQHIAEAINIGYDTLNNWPVETFDFLELPIGCDGEIGLSWGELRHVKQGVTQEECLKILDGIRKKSFEKFGFV